MEQTEKNNIRIAVEEETDLYSPFSPEPEFSTQAQTYLRSKMARIYGLDFPNGIILTVIARKPVNEEKFRSAAANWITQEKEVFRISEKENRRLFTALLLFGSIMVMLSLALVKRFELLQHTLLPIMGSLALSKATGMLLFDFPENKAKRKILDQMEKKNVIVFEYTGSPG